MKIGNSADQAAQAAEALRAAQDGGKAKATGGAAASTPLVSVTESTKVEISGAASSMASDKNEGVFDAEKVARMQEAIANGTYVISPEGIASKLIANAKELLENARAASGGTN